MSMEILNDKVVFRTVYDADMEEPNCGRCDNVCADQKICNNCGPWWANYKRTLVDEYTFEEIEAMRTKYKEIIKCK